MGPTKCLNYYKSYLLFCYRFSVLPCCWDKAVHNEPATAVADKAHWTGLQHVIIITGLTLYNYENKKKKKRYGIIGQPLKFGYPVSHRRCFS